MEILVYLIILFLFFLGRLIYKRSAKNNTTIFINGYECRFSNYHETNFGKVCGIQINTNIFLPNILIDHKRNDRHIYNPYLAKFNLSQAYELKLEGDFSNDTRTYIPQELQILALSILTPDLLSSLKQNNTYYDLLMEQNRIYIFYYTDFIGVSERHRQNLIKIAEVVIKEIKHKSKSWGAENEKQARSNMFVNAFNDDEKYYLNNRVIFYLVIIIMVIFLIWLLTIWAAIL